MGLALGGGCLKGNMQRAGGGPGESPTPQAVGPAEARAVLPGPLTWHGFFTLILLLELPRLDEAAPGQGGDTGDLGQAAGKSPGRGRILALQQELADVDDVGTCQKQGAVRRCFPLPAPFPEKHSLGLSLEQGWDAAFGLGRATAGFGTTVRLPTD